MSVDLHAISRACGQGVLELEAYRDALADEAHAVGGFEGHRFDDLLDVFGDAIAVLACARGMAHRLAVEEARWSS